MISSLGYLAVGGALLLSVVGAVAAFAAMGGRPQLAPWARRAVYGVFALATLAILLMAVALVAHDFSVSYVAQVGSRSTPLFYTVISLWSSLDGSILFWGWILAGYSAAVVYIHRDRYQDLMPAVTGTLLIVSAFFWLLLAWPANPFVPTWQAFGLAPGQVPADGPGPNPLLQNHPFMGLHPPLLYLGYVGLTVPFAFGIAALLSGKVSGDWIRAVRLWTMAPWIFLTAGIVSGAWWSYEVLGWGGYWAWDPVENASFLPWLTATAFLHSIMVQERRQTLKMWNILLVIATFLLTLFGTFLTRSGILASVHAFVEGLIGPFFLGFITLVLIVSLALVAWRSDELKSEPALDAIASRETAFLFNNLLLVAFTFTVLLGTVYPLVAEAIRGVKVSVGAPYFNRMSVPIALGLVLLAGIGPALPWRRGSPDLLAKKFLWPTVAALLSGVVFWVFGARNFLTWLTLVFSVLAVALLIGEFWRPARARREAHGEGLGRALLAVVSKNRRRYGGYVVHFGIVIIAVGIALSSTYRREREFTLGIGEAATFAGYTVRLDSLYAGREPQRDFVEAAFSVGGDGGFSDTMRPRLNYYPTSQQPIGTPRVRTRPDADLYLSLMAYDRTGASATVNIIVNPMVVWIWIGGAIAALGALLAISNAGSGADRSRRAAAPSVRRAKPAEAGVGGDD
ncbi:MAG: heme lyase CcmF/NrfE family subunit [Gemmatimonadota bacterium]|nr:MAG: heme lyase CcmF/NrfE family subunit [Gemmatimonadota bacterium]